MRISGVSFDLKGVQNDTRHDQIDKDHKLGLVRCGLGLTPTSREAGLIVRRLVAWVFQIKTLVAQMPQVLVLGVVGLPADLQRDVMSLGIVDLFIAALDVPLAPRGDDLQVGCKVHDGQLKSAPDR